MGQPYDPVKVLKWVQTHDPTKYLDAPKNLSSINNFLKPSYYQKVKNDYGGALPNKCMKCKYWLSFQLATLKEDEDVDDFILT